MVREAFNKGFEKKWMICEDGGIFKGPQGRHSDRIGDVTIGQIIIADAETYDPDNKIIWRLVDPTPGGWIYAILSGAPCPFSYWNFMVVRGLLLLW